MTTSIGATTATHPPPLDVLVIAPHPDDAEISMGGAIAHLLGQSQRVGILDLTNGEPTPRGTVELRNQETIQASNILNITWRGNLGLPNRALQPTLTAREQIATVMRLCRADLIFAPYWEDAHPDHLAATELTDAARFWAKLSKTDMAGDPFHPKRIYNSHSVHLKLAIRPAFILDISDYWEIKLAAVQAYGSQFDPIDTVVDRNFYDKLRTDAEHWGDLIGCRFGEPFSCREPLGISAIDALI